MAVVKKDTKMAPGSITGLRQTAKAAPKSEKPQAEIKVPVRGAAKKDAEKSQAVETKASKPASASDNVQASGHIIYQTSSQVLERAADTNEIFGIGDSMPIYYL